jgi:hypothetical protein
LITAKVGMILRASEIEPRSSFNIQNDSLYVSEKRGSPMAVSMLCLCL